MVKNIAYSAATVLVLAACQRPAPVTQVNANGFTHYRCEEYRVDIRYDADVGTLYTGDSRAIPLAHVPSASGVKFQPRGGDSGLAFWNKGDEAVLTNEGGGTKACTINEGGRV